MTTQTPDEITALSLWGTRAGGTAPERAQDALNALGQAMQTASPEERARLRHRVGYLALMAGDVRTKAVEAFTLTRDGARESGDKALESLALCGLATAYDHIGQRHEALRYAQEAEALATESGDQRVLAMAYNAQAQFYKETGQNERARELYQRMLAIGETLGDERLVMGAHIGLGRAMPMASAPEAIGHYEQAVELAKTAGDAPSLALCYNNLSDWMIYTGRYERAIQMREECLALARKHGLRTLIGRSLIGMAKAYTLLGDLAKARELLDRGFPTAVSAHDIEGDLHSSLNLAYLYVQQGDVPRATDLYRQTLERSLAAPDHACAVFAQRALDMLADGTLPGPGILPPMPVTDEVLRELDEAELEGVVGGAGGVLFRTYPTGDLSWGG